MFFSVNHACKTPPVEGADAGYLPVPYPWGAKNKKSFFFGDDIRIGT
jgi:hypothetical protein